MKSIKKLSKYQLGLIIIVVLLLLLNYIFSSLYLSKILTLTTYIYVLISYNFIIIITAFIFTKRINHLYRTLTIIMIGVCNLLQSLMNIWKLGGLILTVLFFALIVSLILLFVFATQSADD